MGRAGHHHQVAVEALLEDVPSSRDVGLERDHDDGVPSVLRGQPAQFAGFALRRRWIRGEAVDGHPDGWSGTVVPLPHVPGSNGIGHHQIRRPAVRAEFDAEPIPLFSVAAEYQNGIGVPQGVYLGPQVDRYPAEPCRDEYQADSYRRPPLPAAAARLSARQDAAQTIAQRTVRCG